MTSMRKIFLIFCLMLVAGCATRPGLTLKDIEEIRKVRVESATRFYPNKKKNELQEAILETFRLLDEGDVSFDIRKNKILISRSWTFYAILSASFGKQFWELTLKETEDGTVVSAAFDQIANYSIFPGPVGTNFMENIEIGGAPYVGASADDYVMLLDRIGYLLGQHDSWPECKDYEKNRLEPVGEMVMCDSIGLKDRRPKE